MQRQVQKAVRRNPQKEGKEIHVSEKRKAFLVGIQQHPFMSVNKETRTEKRNLLLPHTFLFGHLKHTMEVGWILGHGREG